MRVLGAHDRSQGERGPRGRLITDARSPSAKPGFLLVFSVLVVLFLNFPVPSEGVPARVPMTTPSVPRIMPWIGRSSRVLYHGSGIDLIETDIVK
jgi:hypothetical protein